MNSVAATASAETVLESAMYLESGTATLFALYTAPKTSPANLGVVFAHSGTNNFSAHRNGVWTTISRRLAREGIPSLRFDYAGTGESPGEFVEGLAGAPVTDTAAAMDALRATGCQRLLIVGSCFGTIPSIAAAVGREDVVGLILLSPLLVLPDGRRVAHMRDRIREVINIATLRTIATNSDYRRWFFARLGSLVRTRASVRARRVARRTAPTQAVRPNGGLSSFRSLLLETELARLVMAGGHVEIVYGSLDDNLARVQKDIDASRAIALLRERGPNRLRWTVLDGPVHGFEDVAVQQQLIQLVVERARDLMGEASMAVESRPTTIPDLTPSPDVV